MIRLYWKIIPLMLVLSVFILATSLCAEMKITLKDGKVIEVPVSEDSIESISYDNSKDNAEDGSQPVFEKNSIRIESAKYGNVSFELGNELGYKQYFCDAKGALVELCDGTKACRIIVGSKICGDPYPGKGKYLYVEYSCGEKLKRAKNTQTEIMKLKCP
ncbi:MAG: hypothetical protein BA863_14595 [Desulfovibrio sp. S3730MH75]|nr:MAG: hypothetical protein BA863_14595 [Desulfovibrio sp. S3730MH75]